MNNFSIIKKSQLEGATRLDAEYYQPKYLKSIARIKSLKSKLLKDLIIKINRGKQPIYKNGDIFALTSEQIRNDFIDTESVKQTNDNFYKSNLNTQLKKYDVLLNSTGVGTLGRVNYYYLNKKAIVDGHITIIRANTNILNPIYLNIFLKTRYGQFQITRSYCGSSGQIELYPEQIQNFVIFIPPLKVQNNVASQVEKAIKLQQESESLFSLAKNLLLDELGLKDFQTDKTNFSIVNLSEIQKVNRIDAEYFQLKYEKLISKIKSKKTKILSDLVSIKRGIEPGSEAYQEKGKSFFRVSNISKNEIIKNDQKYISEEFYQKFKNNFEPKIDEILLTKDATPGIAYTIKEPLEGLISGGILRLNIKKDIEPEYLTLVINSIVGQMQKERDAGGAVILHWRPDQIKNMIIPILPLKTQQKIADLVRKSHKSRKKSKELLEEAKTKVEVLIEKG